MRSTGVKVRVHQLEGNIIYGMYRQMYVDLIVVLYR
jgi:hypothetical protein